VNVLGSQEPHVGGDEKKHLAFDRLAKSSSLDPATLLLIVDARRRSMTTIEPAKLGRIEALLWRNAKTAVEPVMGGPTRDLIVSAITVCLCVVVGCRGGRLVKIQFTTRATKLGRR